MKLKTLFWYQGEKNLRNSCPGVRVKDVNTSVLTFHNTTSRTKPNATEHSHSEKISLTCYTIAITAHGSGTVCPMTVTIYTLKNR